MTPADTLTLVAAAERLEAAIDRHTAALCLVHELVDDTDQQRRLRQWSTAKLVGHLNPKPEISATMGDESLQATLSRPCTCGHTLAQHTMTDKPSIEDEPCNACECTDYTEAT